MTPDQIKEEARRCFERELLDDAVQEELKRLRSQHNQSLWQRLLDKLPFTLTRRNT